MRTLPERGEGQGLNAAGALATFHPSAQPETGVVRRTIPPCPPGETFMTEAAFHQDRGFFVLHERGERPAGAWQGDGEKFVALSSGVGWS